MSYALVHASHGNSGAGANAANPFNLTVTATTVGNVGVLDFETGNGETLTSVTDSGSGNTWHQIGSQVSDTTNGQLYYRFYLLISGGFSTIHLTGNAALQAISWVFGEYSSTNGWAATPLNVFNNGTLGALSTGTDAVLSNNITPLSTDLLVSGLDSGDGNAPTFTAGTGWTLAAADAGTASNTGATGQEWKAATSGASQHSTWTTSASQLGGAAAIASFSQGTPGFTPSPVIVLGKLKQVLPAKVKQPLAIKAPAILAPLPAPVVTAIAKVTPKRTTPAKTKQPLRVAPAAVTAQMAPPTNTIAVVKPKPTRPPVRQVTYIAPMIVTIPGPAQQNTVQLVTPKRVAAAKVKQPLRIRPGVAPQPPGPAVSTLALVKPKQVAPARKIRLVAIAPARIVAAAAPPVVTTLALVTPRRTFPAKTKQPLAVRGAAITAASVGLRQLPVVGVGQ